eukprot:TRINITY_DN4794_c0_g1_i1.p1 TRINITY_DN4794_c0_g1~~TRINITY_DN4794_c0_g1_i1.p1  ORF type:complete len:143 (-),score=58.05 TRINITY_DN4794_c0_g1_i1:501-929(-)
MSSVSAHPAPKELVAAYFRRVAWLDKAKAVLQAKTEHRLGVKDELKSSGAITVYVWANTINTAEASVIDAAFDEVKSPEDASDAAFCASVRALVHRFAAVSTALVAAKNRQLEGASGTISHDGELGDVNLGPFEDVDEDRYL